MLRPTFWGQRQQWPRAVLLRAYRATWLPSPVAQHIKECAVAQADDTPRSALQGVLDRWGPASPPSTGTVLAGMVELKLGMSEQSEQSEKSSTVSEQSATVYCSVVRSGQSVTMDFREDSSASAASFSPCGSLALDLSAEGHAMRRSTTPGCPADELEVLVAHKARAQVFKWQGTQRVTIRVGACNNARMLSRAVACLPVDRARVDPTWPCLSLCRRKASGVARAVRLV